MHVDVWLIVVSALLTGALGFLAGTAVEGRRRSRAERAMRAECRRQAVARYVEDQSRVTTLEDRVLAERVADVLENMAVRTAAATEPGATRP